jgi:formate dehydrogenase/NADH-quinone oxidoreductase subunit F
VLRFFRDESCGKCVPCRVGSAKAHAMLTDGAPPEHVAELAETMRRTSICGLGQVALGPVMSAARLTADG